MNETDNGTPDQIEDIQTNEVDGTVQEAEQPEITEEKPEGDKPEGDSSEKKRNRPPRDEREKTRLLNRIAELEANQSKSNGSPPQDDEEPKIEDFEDAIEWAKAQAKYEAKQAVKGYKAEQSKAAEQAQLQEIIEDHIDRETEYAETVPDYEEKVTSLLQSGLVTPEIQVAVLHSEMSPQLAYYFANYTDGQSDLMALQAIKNNPAALRQAITKIEAYVKENSNKVTAVKTTQAAAPINPPKSNAGGSTKDVTKLSFQEFVNKAAPIK